MFWGCFSSLNMLSSNFSFCMTFYSFMLMTSPLLKVDLLKKILQTKDIHEGTFKKSWAVSRLCKMSFSSLFFLFLQLYFRIILGGSNNSLQKLTKNKSMKTRLTKTSKKIKVKLKKKKQKKSHCYITYSPPHHWQPQCDEGVIWDEPTIGTGPQRRSCYSPNISSVALKCENVTLRDTQCELDMILQRYKGKYNLR